MKPAQLTRLLLAGYALLAFLSWIANVMMPEWQGHSLLSAESVRHLATHTVAYMAPWLLYAMMIGMVTGCIMAVRKCRQKAGYRLSPRVYVWIAVEVVLCVMICYWLSWHKGAPLRGIDGHIMSPQLLSIAPFLLLSMLIFLATITAWHTRAVSTWQDIYRMWVNGMKRILPYILPLLIGIHLIYTLIYVLGG